MSLSVSNSPRHKGVFVNKAIVKSVVDLSHQPLPFIGKAFDLAIEATFDIGKSFDKKIMIFGNFKRDVDNRILSLGAAFKVARFFEVLNIRGELTPTNDIPMEWLAQVVGRVCYTLDYLTAPRSSEPTKGKYYTSDIISADAGSLVDDFYRQVAKGFPKNFNPNALDADQVVQGDAYEGPTVSIEQPMEEMVF
jgi:hypothetical protein